MKINVHIERLILDGLPIGTSQGKLVQASIERELASLLSGNGLASELIAGGAVSHLPAGSIQLARDSPPPRVGQQIARAVHSRIGGEATNDLRRG